MELGWKTDPELTMVVQNLLATNKKAKRLLRADFEAWHRIEEYMGVPAGFRNGADYFVEAGLILASKSVRENKPIYEVKVKDSTIYFVDNLEVLLKRLKENV